MTQQNLVTIKQISIPQYLSRLGIEPVNKTGRALLYHAPYRTDNHPSFVVSVEKNTWHDYATGEGTSIIDLVMKMQNINFKEAIKYLSGQNDITAVPQAHYPITAEKDPGIVILKEKTLNNPALITYLQERCIDIPIAQKHCREIYYAVDEKRYFGIGFKNDRGGYEIRNKYFKGATSKDITTIHHKDVFACHIYEGFLDYLSHLTIDKYNMTNNSENWLKITPGENVIILNSVTNINKVKDFLKHNQLMVTAYLDNDDAGRRVTEELRGFMCPKYPVIDASICYQDHKDINEYLISMNKKKQKNIATSKIKIS